MTTTSPQKNILSITLLLLTITTAVVGFTQQNHPRVILIGIDGFNPNLLKNATQNSTFEWLIKNGAHTMEARTMIQAISASGWSSIICSLDPIATGILNNEWVPTWINDTKNEIKPILGNGRQFPCVFQQLKQFKPEIHTTFYYNWDWLKYMGNHGMKGDNIDDEYYCQCDLSNTTEIRNCDKVILEKTLNRIKNEDFGFMFSYFNSIDATGHESKWGSEEQLKAVGDIDDKIAKIIDALREKDLLESTYILITSDHGASMGALNHMQQNDANILVPVFAYGPGIKKNYLIDEDAVIYTLDIAPTISHLFGVRKHKIWRGRVFNEIFEEKTPADEYTGKSDLNCNKSENETSEEKSSL